MLAPGQDVDLWLPDLAHRSGSFDEVPGGLTEENALFEARRCLSCGTGFECDNRCGSCPDNAVIKRGPGQRFRFNCVDGRGCGLCATGCPSGAIERARDRLNLAPARPAASGRVPRNRPKVH